MMRFPPNAPMGGDSKFRMQTETRGTRCVSAPSPHGRGLQEQTRGAVSRYWGELQRHPPMGGDSKWITDAVDQPLAWFRHHRPVGGGGATELQRGTKSPRGGSRAKHQEEG